MNGRTRRKSNTETVTLDFLPNGRDEMNLAEFPIALLADRAPKDAKTLIFRDGTGELTVTGSDAYGLPTALDADVIVALIQLTKQRNDFTSPCVPFTRYELLRLLGWPNEGKSYRRIDEALNRWVGVSLHYDGCWWDNRSKQYGDAKIHILESVVILDGKSRIEGDEQHALPLSTFTWNKIFMESCQADNLKRLNVEAYFALKHPSSKRLYRFLDKRFYRRPECAFDLREIAFERVGLSRNYGRSVGRIKEKLQPAIDELESREFLEPMTRDQRYFKEGTEWKVRFVRKVTALPESPASPAAGAGEPVPLLVELVKRGVTESTAAELVQQYRDDPSFIELKLEVFDWLIAKQDKRATKSPAGFLFSSITKRYATPKGFVSKAERERLAEMQRRADQRAAEARQVTQQAEAKERAEDAAVSAYWEGLTMPQRAELEAAALAEADPETMQLAKGSMRKIGLRIARNNYIRKFLQVEGKLPLPTA